MSKGLMGDGAQETKKAVDALLSRIGAADCDMENPEQVRDLLKQAIKRGGLDPAALTKAMVLQKAMAAAGVSPELVAKAVAVQKTMAENGMAVSEIANAMTLAMNIAADNKNHAMANGDIATEEGKVSLQDMEAQFQDLLKQVYHNK